jgi:hypothetical protein
MTTASTERTPRPFVALAALVAIVLAATVLLRLSAYGVWDPWELTVADAARKLGEDTDDTVVSLGLRLVHASFAVFGTREWAGRLPMALSGLALLVVIALWVRRYAGGRPALYAALALGTTPMFLLHSREMVGATPTFLMATLIACGACNAIFVGSRDEPSSRAWAWLALAAIACVVGATAGGVLVAVLPSLAAVACTALLVGAPWDRALAPARRISAWVIIGTSLVLGAMVFRAVFRHAAEFSLWTGGAPLDEAVPTFERIIAHLFHGLAPWSAIAPVALGGLLARAPARADTPLRLVCTLWAGLAFAAVTVFLSSYGALAYPAVAAVAVAVALWLRDLDVKRESFWAELVIVLLLLGLVIRDYGLYPASAYNALELVQSPPPDRFNPKSSWSTMFGLFAVGLVLSCMATPERAPLDLRAPYRGLRALWDRGAGYRGWLVVLGIAWLGLLLFGVLALIHLPGVRLSSLSRRIGQVVGASMLLLPVLLAAGQAGYHVSRKLAPVRNLPLTIAALAIGVYAGQVFLPKLSAHFSPREVFDTFEKLSQPNEPLAQHQVPGRAAAYYVSREVRDIASESDLVNFLTEPGRRWALVPNERFADLDVAFRKRTGRHLYVPSEESARVVLVANEAVANRPDENPLTKYVLKDPPAVEHPLSADFDGKIELLGYSLELPQKTSVGPGQTFTVTWVFRALRSNLEGYQAFLHVDSAGQRINGDHDPVDGKYPVRLWVQGDVVVDRQRISVPATASPGTYSMYVGFFRGETRMKVVSGPKDDADRVIAGTIQIR